MFRSRDKNFTWRFGELQTSPCSMCFLKVFVCSTCRLDSLIHYIGTLGAESKFIHFGNLLKI